VEELISGVVQSGGRDVDQHFQRYKSIVSLIRYSMHMDSASCSKQHSIIPSRLSASVPAAADQVPGAAAAAGRVVGGHSAASGNAAAADRSVQHRT
jgi:hypothetical protein